MANVNICHFRGGRGCARNYSVFKMFGFLWKKDADENETVGSNAVVANMGTDNTMYFNKDLKAWVEPGKEEEVREKLAPTPPAEKCDDPRHADVFQVSHLKHEIDIIQIKRGRLLQEIKRQWRKSR